MPTTISNNKIAKIMTQEEFNRLASLQKEITALENHLKYLLSRKVSGLIFGCDNDTDIVAKNSICNVNYLYNAYIHQVQSQLNTKKRIFEKYKLVQ